MALVACLFDIDGTLADTGAAIREAVTQVLQEEGITPTWEEIRSGWTLPAADRMALWVRDRRRAEALAERYVARYLALQENLVRPYAGMDKTLARLQARGIALGVVTSKRRIAALRTLRTLGLEQHFPVVVCEEDVPAPKPDPSPLLLAAERLGVPPALSVMVGDGEVDVAAGKAAGMHTAGALWGTVAREALRAAGPDWLLQTPDELLSLFPG